jgi:hypothetical protein
MAKKRASAVTVWFIHSKNVARIITITYLYFQTPLTTSTYSDVIMVARMIFTQIHQSEEPVCLQSTRIAPKFSTFQRAVTNGKLTAQPRPSNVYKWTVLRDGMA